MGMSIGPLMAAILDNTAGRDLRVDLNLPFTPAGGIVYNHVTSPGFVMAALWFLEMLFLFFFFKEPDRINSSESDTDTDHDNDIEEEKELLTRTDYGSITSSRHTIEGSSISSFSGRSLRRQSTGLWGELCLTWSLFSRSPGLCVTLLVFCFIELADEVLISSCSMVVRRYFGWHGSAAGFLIASLGALVLPANFLVESYSHHVSERRIMKVKSISCFSFFMCCSC
jgi:hypothetical protein